MSLHRRTLASLFVFASAGLGAEPANEQAAANAPAAATSIRIEPGITRAIGGVSELHREQYFSICDPGSQFDKRTRSQERYDYLTRDLKVHFGRQLGPVRAATYGKGWAVEDGERPGYVDRQHTKNHLTNRRKKQSAAFIDDFGPNLNVAAHGQGQSFPAFMGEHLSEWMEKEKSVDPKAHLKGIPKNIDAAAELSALVFAHAYDDFTRPAYYEPVNEPHWSYVTDPQHLADWHMATMKKVHEATPDVLVGGPCYSVGYFYSEGYKPFNAFKSFIDATDGQLDFYSFHVYDFLQWNGDRFEGSITGGLPLEGVLDLVPNYTQLKYGKETPMVISETGGYLNAPEKTAILKDIARKHQIPGEGFDWEMNTRSIHDFLQVSATIANTLTFMEHPHTVKKAVPFVLLETSAWNPKYYATLYTPEDFDPKSKVLRPSRLHDFYRLFSKLEGRRVRVTCPDPDVQTRAFVKDQSLRIVANNLSNHPEVLSFEAPPAATLELLRYGQNENLTPRLDEESPTSLKNIPLGPRETIVLTAHYDAVIKEESVIDERPYYGTKLMTAVDSSATFEVTTPDPGRFKYASLRIGYNRPHGSSPDLKVELNGHPIEVPREDAADRYNHEKHGYSTTKIVPVPVDFLKAGNTITVTFPDSKGGVVGSTVIRTGVASKGGLTAGKAPSKDSP